MKHTLLAGTAALVMALAAGPAFAEDDYNAEVVNGQLNMGTVWAGLNLTVYDVANEVNATAAGIGNSFSAELGGDAMVNNFQRSTGFVGAELNASVDWVEGDVNLTTAAVANTASIINEPYTGCGEQECVPLDEASLTVTNRQIVGYEDPYARLNVTASGVGTLNGTAAAISNSLSVEARNDDTSVNTWQRVGANTTALVNASISGADGVNLTSAAVGNTVSINNLIN